ncbi:MAG: bifunctional YncE family protein/alkaline phosphatase family protein [Bacteroidetes bacterium]|nr:bifunctional YncE family protein/alkaline phosphatase family protein [Bacteroidota bacterium]
MKALNKSSYILTLSILIAGLIPYKSGAQSLQEIESNRITLSNGWSLTPSGKQINLGDLPLNIAVSPSKKLLAVTNNGESDQSIELFDANSHQLLDSVTMGKSWLGLAFSSDEKSLYASGGYNNFIVHFAIKENKLSPVDTIRLGKPWPTNIGVAGITIDDKHHILYVVTKDDNSLYVADLLTKKVIAKHDLGGEGYTCILSPDANTLYISCWGCDKVRIFDTKKQLFSGSIDVGDNPNDLCLTRNGEFLFVANSNDNSVSVINTKNQKVVETLNAALFPNALNGSTTNSIALSEDQKTLFIANADNNCLAVFNVTKPGSSLSKGFIPVGWYPTCVRVIKHTLFVANGKGLSSLANPFGPNPLSRKQKVDYQKNGQVVQQKVQYIGGLFRGSLSIIPIPKDEQLSLFSQAVYHNTPYSKEKEIITEGKDGNPIPYKTGAISPIKYVFYVIKENRTYDQVLGDITEGNGNKNLTIFGEKVTPNLHALAREFVLLDNFYCDGEVSADGHNWCAGAYATDYLEKTWPTSYGSRGGNYDAEGIRAIANNKNGFIWDNCKRKGVSYRTYGEFMNGNKPNIASLRNHFCPTFTGWDQSVHDTTRFTQWRKEFDSLVANNELPQLNTVRFINDHTEGLRIGKHTPLAAVADNDLAVGLFIEHLSKSKIWNQCAVFIVEDDAQNGPDHVDAHRTTAYVAGGFVKQGFVDHTPYSTASMVRTLELILGLPPMSQYDAAATPMWRCFSEVSNHPVFKARPNNIDLEEKNSVISKWSKKSELFDFSNEDRAPEAELNEVLWIAVKGENSHCPAPVHAAFVKTITEED